MAIYTGLFIYPRKGSWEEIYVLNSNKISITLISVHCLP